MISTELPQNSDQLKTTLPILTKNTPLQRLKRQNSIHCNTEPVILNTSTQTVLTKNQYIQLAPQQLTQTLQLLTIYSSVYTNTFTGC